MILHSNLRQEGRLAHNRFKPILTIVLMLIFFLQPVYPMNNPVVAQEKDQSSNESIPSGSIDFDACVRVALDQSPHFTQSAIEIDVSRLRESDNRWSFIPSVTLQTISYLELDDRGTTVAFNVEKYNPLLPYFSLKASKLITKMAILTHLKRISEGVHQLARKILEMYTLEQLDECQDRIVALADQKLAFYKKRHDGKTASLLEVHVADQQFAVEQAKSEKLAALQEATREEILAYLGALPTGMFDIDLRQARLQILGNFNPAVADPGQAQDHSFELKMHELKKKLQTYKIYLAYSKFLPSVNFGMRDRNAFDSEEIERDDDFYVNVGVELNLWRGFKEVNDVTRQKLILRKYESETRLKENDLKTKWRVAQTELQKSEIALKLARSNEELVRLRERQSEIHYNSNGQSLSALLDSRMALLQAQEKRINMVKDHDLNVLKIRHLTGDLFNSHIHVAPWED